MPEDVDLLKRSGARGGNSASEDDKAGNLSSVNVSGGAPVFLKQPSDSYVIKSSPATLHCRVANAVDLHFQCNSEVLSPTRRDDHVEPETGLRYTDASVQISRDKVEEYFGEFHCSCVATSATSESVQSRHALVTFACKYHSYLNQPTMNEWSAVIVRILPKKYLTCLLENSPTMSVHIWET